MVQKGAIKIQYVSTDEQVTDVLTKPISWVKFEYFHDKISVVRKEFPCKEEQWWYYGLSLQQGMMKIWNLFGKEEQVKDMDSHRKGIIGQRYEPSLDKGGVRWWYGSSLERENDDKIVIDDGMTLKL